MNTTLQLWITKVGESTRQIEQQIIPLLSFSEKKRIQATKSINKQREFLLSRALMRHAFSEQYQYPVNQWRFVENSHSTPSITNLPNNTHFSLSHSNGIICFATSPYPIGVDIEKINKQRDFLALADCFMNADEFEALKAKQHDEKAKYFYRIWCAKEAYYKANNSTTTQLQLGDVRNLPILKIIKEHPIWNYKEYSLNSFWLTLVTRHTPAPIKINLFPSDFALNSLQSGANLSNQSRTKVTD